MDRTTLLRNLKPWECDGIVQANGKGKGNKVSLHLSPKGYSALREFLSAWCGPFSVSVGNPSTK